MTKSIEEILINGYYLKDETGLWETGSVKVITSRPETIKALEAREAEIVRQAKIDEVQYLHKLRDMNGKHYFRKDKLDERLDELEQS